MSLEIPPKSVRQMEAIGFLQNEECKMVTSCKVGADGSDKETAIGQSTIDP